MEAFHNFFDFGSGFFWSLTYILIAYTSLINENDSRLSIPITTLAINFSWETASVIYSVLNNISFSNANFIRFAWFFLDVLIVIAFFNKKHFNKKVCLLKFSLLYIVLCVLFIFIFITTETGMVISSFIIDIHMAFMFFVFRKHLDPSLRMQIATFKLIGDVSAGLSYSFLNTAIPILSSGSFILNLLYLIYAINEKKNYPEFYETYLNNKRIYYKRIKKVFINQQPYKHSKKRHKK
jgi:hypothetical protein